MSKHKSKDYKINKFTLNQLNISIKNIK